MRFSMLQVLSLLLASILLACPKERDSSSSDTDEITAEEEVDGGAEGRGDDVVDGDADTPVDDDVGDATASAVPDESMEAATGGSLDAGPQGQGVRAEAGSGDADPTARPEPGEAGSAQTGVFTGEIEAAAMERSMGGFPVAFWLYKGGFAPDDTDGLLPIPAEAIKHRAANPDLWTEWRRTPQGVERKIGQNWKLLAYNDEYAPLPKGTTVTGVFSRSNTGYEVVKYRFYANSRFEYCSYTSVIGRRTTGRGAYEIDGYVLRLIYSNATQGFSFIYDPTTRPNTLWVDEVPYKRDNTPDATLSCP